MRESFLLSKNLNEIPMKKITPEAARLFGFSFLILFFELALIRYIPANVRIVSFFTNLILIADFLGMCTGLIISRRKMDLGFYFPLALVILTTACVYFSNIVVEGYLYSNEFLWANYHDLSPKARELGIVPVVSVLFVLTTFVFVPLGQLVGREFEKFPPLIAYNINVFGSLMGLLVFSLLSKMALGPMVWFALGMTMFLILSRNKWERLISIFCFLLIAVHIATISSGQEIWSPYYKINVNQKPTRIDLNVNGSIHQLIMNFSDENVSKQPLARESYNDLVRPYRLVESVERVLILGSGTGNDVAVALKQNAGEIDAVEIDPKIIELGKRLHFQKPYDDPRVNIHIQDARAFLNSSSKKYDLIVLGTLDSQTLLSGLSSVRLDNYVFTYESFNSMRDHLKPGGKIIVYQFAQPYIAFKIYSLLTLVFGHTPLMNIDNSPTMHNYTFISSEDRFINADFKDFHFVFDLWKRGVDGVEEELKFPAPTDDWPYLYLKEPGIAEHYWQTGLLIAIFTVVLVGAATGIKSIGKPDWTMFCLGTGFLLLETKSVTEMSLLFGSTWQVNVLVFSSILLIILAANSIVIRAERINLNLCFASLFVLVGVSYFVPITSLLNLSIFWKWVLGSAIVSLPLFFSALIFASIFKTREQAVYSLGYNLIGAILGGLVEYGSMVTGIKSLYLFSLIFYLLAYGFQRR